MTSPDSSVSTQPSGLAVGSAVEARIPMDDGIELAATLYLPDPATGSQPCIIEALPYRKDDLTSSSSEYERLRDEYGYAVCRLDLRGTGSSGGDATDEYPVREQQDLSAVMSWLAEQDWCDGNLGMYGTSYSGFNSLQMACEQPPELKAVIAIYATDDRYTDDVHYRGGSLKWLDLVDYNHYMTALNALPPVPAVWGAGWREEWLRRVEVHEPWVLTWLREQRGGAYWRHGSVRPDYDRIACPTMLIAGWADGYRNNSFRTVEQLRANGVPHRLLAGPWAHADTSTALPGPRIDAVPEMVAWWDRWLRGVDNGVDDGLNSPSSTVFIRSSTVPEPALDMHLGSWVREEWPSPRVEVQRFMLDSRAPLSVDPATGVDAWIDCAGHLPYGLSLDQRHDDAQSLTWDFDAAEIVVLGQPVARLQLSVDAPVATASVKLCDVFPDGTSALVARASLNLTHRDGHEDLSPMVPGQVYDIAIELDACAYQFEPGQRLRLSITGSDWPNTSAPPAPVRLTVHGGELELPVWSGPSPYPAPVLTPPADPSSGESSEGVTWRVERDVLRNEVECVVDHGSSYAVPYDGRSTEHYSGRVHVNQRTFEQHAHAETSINLEWPGTVVSTSAVMDVSADAHAFDVTIDLTAREGDSVVGTRHWQERIPRDLG